MTQPLVRFEGTITGLGSSSGVRCVVGRWVRSPYGSFTDVMVERTDGRRILIAPSRPVADFVSATYRFDEVRIEPVTVTARGARRELTTGSLRLSWTLGRPTWVGRLLGLVPRPVARTRSWARMISPVARIVRGANTFGTAGRSRVEWYCATGERRVSTATGRFDGVEMGRLRPVRPPVRFGFASTPPRPAEVEVTTWIRLTTS